MTTVDGSDLVAKKEGVTAAAGAPLVQDSLNFAKELSNDPLMAGIDGALVGLDVLGVVMDPFGSLFGEVAGYIIEHVGFLNQFMDDISGDPQGIEAASQTWKNIASKLTSCGQDYQSALSTVGTSWDDAAASAYGAVAQTYIDSCYAVSAFAELFSEAITVAGMLCAKTRQDIYDAIGDLITDLVIAGLAALATSWCTFGGSLAAWICDMEIQGDMTAASISTKIASLLGKLGTFGAKFGKDADTIAKMGDKLTQASQEFQKGAQSLKKEAEELQETKNGIGKTGAHAAAHGSGHGDSGGGKHEAPPEQKGPNPLESGHEAGDVGVRGARDEVNAHRHHDEEGGGE